MTPSSAMDRLRASRAALRRRQRAVLIAVERDLLAYREEIARALIRTRGVNPDLVRLTNDLQVMELTLTAALTRSVRNHRRLTITDMLTLWSSEGVDRRLARRLTEAALYSQLREGVTFRTALQTATAAAHGEVVELIAEGIRHGESAAALAKTLIPYLDGATTIPLAAGGYLDLRRVPTPLRGQARQLRYNATRIAVTELSIARAEAEAVAFLNDATVRAVRWVVASARGRTRIPDVCDMLAELDAYHLGPGVYPVDRVPPVPHPFCRCSRQPLRTGERRLGQSLFPVNLTTVDGFTDHPPGMQRKITDQLGTALADGPRAGAVVQEFLSTAS